MKKYWTLAALTACTVGLAASQLISKASPVAPDTSSIYAVADDKSKQTEKPAEKKAAEKEEKRFDEGVREDIFAGFQGDKEALERGIKTCEEALQKDPKHAEALVWRGAARVFQAGQLMQKGKQAEGIKVWTAGLKDMDDANEIKPNDISVMIPRAAVLTGAGKNAPKAFGEPLLKKALADFQAIEKRQKDFLDKIGTHSLGELRMGQADLQRALGNADESKKQLEAVIKELPDTKYAKRAKEWLEAKADAKLNHTCMGCHTK